MDHLVAALAQEAPTGTPLSIGAIDGFVDGFALDRIMSTRAAVEPLCAMFGFDVVMSGGVLRMISRADGKALWIGQDDLVPDRDGRLAQLTRAQESDVPSELSLSFSDSARDYRPASILSRRLEGWSRRQSQAEVGVVMERAQARRRADSWLQDLWLARETVTFRLRPNLVALETGDAVMLDVDGARRLYRIQRITDGAQRVIEARAFDPLVYDAPPAFTPSPVAVSPQLPGPCYPIALDLAIANDGSDALQHLAVFADPWPGALALWRGTGGSFAFERTITRCAIIGETVGALSSGPVGRLDRGATLQVRVRGGALASVSEQQMLGGANVGALRGVDGAWEIFGFANAELVGPGVYRLSTLLRGLGGEEYLAQRALPAGAMFVLLDSAVIPLVSGLAQLGAQISWRVGPADRDYADPSCVSFDAVVGAKALMPYAPARVVAARGVDGVTFSLLRRGRRDGDGWQLVDIPLGEDIEAYDIDILRNGLVTRALSSASPSVLYPAAQEALDFGGAQSAFDIQAFQKSAAVGRGFALTTRVLV